MLPKVDHIGTQVHTALEEVLHAATHGIGIVLAVVALVFMVLKAQVTGGAIEMTAVTIYGGSAVLLYLASTIYHAAFNSAFQPFLEVVDHAAIYLKIAGSYTPFALLTLPEGTGRVVLFIVWGIAFSGIAFKFLSHAFGQAKKKYDWLSLASYVGMGWVGIFVARELFLGLSAQGFFWVIAGGLFFTIGAAFYAWKSRRFTHTIFHVFVLAGSVCHFVAVYGFVLGQTTTA